MSKERLVTGIKPTGDVHIGNFLGAMSHLATLQDQYECFIFVADIHALNQGIGPEELRRTTLLVTRAYLASGINPEKVVLFKQSAVPAHGQLAQILGSQVGLGYLERSHAYKDALANGKSPNWGLFSYPILMAADILLYEAEVVPVGKDQFQHLEITRDLAQQYNSRVGSELFVLPKTLASENPILPGLDGRKMSKSYGNILGIFEDSNELLKKVMRITTDSKQPEDRKNPDDTIAQLMKSVACAEDYSDFISHYSGGGMGYKEAKDRLARALIKFVESIQQESNKYSDAEIEGLLAVGAQRAQEVAETTLLRVRRSLGMEA